MTELCHTGRGLSEEFDDDFQNRLAAYFCRDHEFLTRAGDLVAPNQFSNAANAILVNMVSGYYRMYKSAPSSSAILDMLKRAKRDKTIREELFPDVVEAFKRILAEKLSDTAYMVDQVATFAKSVAFDDALIKAAEMKEKGDFQGAMAIMAKVQQIGSNEATGIYDYFSESAERYKAREYEASDDYVPNSITTGLPLLDKLLYQKGWAKREMVLFMGFAKSGKSTAMGEFSINATLAGYNVLYLSLEVHTSILSDRFDLDRMLGSMKANGMIPDMVVVDYADLMRASYDLRDDRANIRSIYTDLRALYDKRNVAGITASQTNREGGASEVATMMHAADNIEKVRIADLVITINKTEEEEAKGEARLYFAGSRNQKGGVSIRVKQNLEQMRFIERIMDVL